MKNPKSTSHSALCIAHCAFFILVSATYPVHGGTVEADTVLADEIQTRVISYPNPSLTDGLVLYYSFETNMGIAYDASGNSHHGAIAPQCVWTNEGRFAGGAMAWTGTNAPEARIMVGHSPNFTSWDAYSVSIWFQLRRIPYSFDPLSPRGGYTLFMKSDFGVQPGGLSMAWLLYRTVPVESVEYLISGVSSILSCPVDTLQEGAWRHVVIVRDGDVGQLWVDGLLKVSNTNMVSLDGEGLFLTLGEFYTPLGYYPDQTWSGLMDEFRIYKRALSPTEIAYLHYLGTLPPPQPQQTNGVEAITVASDLAVAGELSVAGDATFLSGVQLAQPLGDLSSGSYTNAPPAP